MIEKFDDQNGFCMADCMDKINEVIDVVNTIQKEREAEWFEIKEWIGIVSDLRSRVPVVESRVSILEEHAHPTAKTPADPYAEQRKWIGKLCWVWDDDGDERAFTKLREIIEDDDDRPFKCFSRWKHCEPVKPDDDIIYKGE